MRLVFHHSVLTNLSRPGLLLLGLAALPAAVQAQTPGGPGPIPGGTARAVGINTTTPDPSAALDIQSSSQGVLIPRLTRLQRRAIASPKPGLLVYQTGSPAAADSAGFWLRGPVSWQYLEPLRPVTISKTGSQISLAGGGSGSVTDADEQQLSKTGSVISLTNGGSVTDGDEQQLSKTGNQISLTNGGSVTDSDNQQLTASTAGGVTTLTLTNGGTATVPSSADNLGNHSATTTLALNDQPIRLRGAADANHWVGYDSGLDGARVQGNLGGVLSSPLQTALRWNSTGQVGVGPSIGLNGSRLTVQTVNSSESGVYVTLTGSATTPSLKLEHNGSNFIVRPLSGGGNSTIVENTGGGALSLNPSGGNVGIGTGSTAPRGRLDVGTGDTYLVADANTGSGQSVYLPGHLFLAPYTGTSGTAYIQARVPNMAGRSIGLTFRTTDNGTLRDVLTLNANGSAVFSGTVTATSFSPSDQRLKQNIRPLGQSLPSVLALRSVRYTYRQDLGRSLPQGEQVGLLAQEVERLYPELVTTGADGYKAVNYAQLTPVLLEALKELAAKNAALEQQVSSQQRALEGDHAALLTLQAQMARLQEAVAPAGQARR